MVSQDERHKIIVNEEGCEALLITSAQLGDEGTLGCIARNRSGETSTMVTIFHRHHHDQIFSPLYFIEAII